MIYSFQQLTDTVEQQLAALDFPATPDGLYAPIRYALEGGGKRVRPVLALMVCNLFDAKIDKAMPSALAIEVYHNCTLLHDDIMDCSDMRRGRPAVHKQWDQSTAILSGDQMIIASYALLVRSEQHLLGRLLEVFNRTATGVSEGQRLDIDFEQRDKVSIDEYLGMIRMKTAILLAGAVEMGAVCGGARDEQLIAKLYQFGMDLGMAFQIQDDLLDTYGNIELLGKPVGGDILVAKKNFLLSCALETADRATRAQLLAYLYDQDLAPDKKIAAVRAIYDRLGIRRMTEERILSYFSTTSRVLDSLDFADEKLAPLRELADNLVDRQK